MGDDLISRQAAIDALEKKKDKKSQGDIGGFYNKIIQNDIDTLVLLPTADRPQWIPCSERLPEDSGEYLVCPSDSVLEDYSDFSDVMIMPYDADCEAFGWWTERYDPISLGFVDSDFNEFEVLAWMPLPTAYKGADDETD